MADRDQHLLLTPKAGQTLALGGFAFAADALMLAGDSLAWCGLFVAVALCGFILWLNAEELAAAGRARRFNRHLAIPAAVLVMVIGTGWLAFKKEVLDAVTAQQFLVAAWKTIAGGAVGLVMNPETWFVVVVGWAMFIALSKRGATPKKPDTGERLAEIIRRAPHPRGVDEPDYPMWDSSERYRLYQAAFLWAELRPPNDATIPVRGRANEAYEMLRSAILSGKIDTGNLNSIMIIRGAGDQSEAIPPGVSPQRWVARSELIKFAEHSGQKPRFLYPSERP